MRFIEKTDCKQSVSNGSVNALSTYKIKNVFLPTLGFAADSSCCSWMISNLLQDTVASIKWKLKHFQTMYKSDS